MSVELREALERAATKPRRDLDVAAVYLAGSRRRRRKTAAAGLAAVLLVGVLTTSLMQVRSAPSVILQSPPTTSGWHPIPEAPITARYDHVAAWAGDEMLVWGGRDRADTYFRDGAAYDRRTQVWRRIPQAPIDGRVHAASAWTGEKLLVVGGWAAPPGDTIEVQPDGGTGMRYFSDGAAYDLATDSWRTIAPFPLQPRADAAAVWTGQELLIWGGRTFNTGPVAFFDNGAAYDPAKDTWRILAAAPLRPRAGHSTVWTGRELVVYGGVASMNTFEAFRDGAAYDPGTDTWRGIASGPQTQGNPSMRFNAAAWTGEEMIIWTGRKTAAYNPASNQWRRAADDPFPGFERIVGPGSVVWTGSQMLTWGGWGELDDPDRGGPQADGAAYVPATDSWAKLEESPLQPRDGHTLVWTGYELIIWGGETLTNGLLGDDIETVGDGGVYIPPATHASDPPTH